MANFSGSLLLTTAEEIASLRFFETVTDSFAYDLINFSNLSLLSDRANSNLID